MNLLDLYVNIVAKDEASGQIDSVVGNISNKLKGGLGTAAKAGAAAMGAVTAAAASGAVALGTAALNSYAEYEQLAGGIEKLYGESSDTMMRYAQDAYRTAGMSANEYMQTATSFSAALIKSLGGDTEEAARLSDVAMRAISDNVNTFGSDAEAVKGAIMGLSRENYTMLDNLKLGYAGTAQGMLELINDSGVLGYELTNVSELSEVGFAKMVEAIQAVQEQQNIAGTTAREASSTIQGSIGAAKAAWQNLLTAIATPDADIGDTVERFTDAANDVVTNVLETVQRIIPGITEMMVELVQQVVPMIADITATVVETIVPLLPELVSTVAQAIVTLIPVLLEAAIQLFMALVQALPEILPALIDAVIDAIDMVIDMLPTLLPVLLEAAIRLFMALVEAIPRIIPALIQAIPTVISAVTSTLLNNIPLLLQCAVELFMALVTAVPMVLGELLGAVGELLQGVWDTITSFDLGEAAGQLIQGFINGIRNMGGAVINAVSGVFGGAIDFVKGLFGIASPSKVFEGFGEMLDAGMAKGILGSGDDITDAFDSVMGGLTGSAMNVSVNARGLPSMTASTMAGVVITGNTFNVRNESDIEDIANRLALLIDRRG